MYDTPSPQPFHTPRLIQYPRLGIHLSDRQKDYRRCPHSDNPVASIPKRDWLESEERETDRAGAIVGIIVLIIGWYFVFYIIDQVFIEKSGVASQPFFLIELVIAFVLLIAGILLVAKYTRYLGIREADGRKEVLKAERDRLKDNLVKAGICTFGVSLIMVLLALVYPSWFLLSWSALVLITFGGIISFLAGLLAMSKD